MANAKYIGRALITVGGAIPRPTGEHVDHVAVLTPAEAQPLRFDRRGRRRRRSQPC